MKIKHCPDWVPEKQHYLESVSNLEMDESRKQHQKYDFRLRCKEASCQKKIDLYCPGCSSSTFTCSLCVPICFKKYYLK